jgi:hypothetical protein
VLLNYDNKLTNRATGRSYNAATIYNAIMTGIAQSEPVRVTLLDGTTMTAGMLPNPAGETLIDVTKATQKPKNQKLSVTFREYA